MQPPSPSSEHKRNAMMASRSGALSLFLLLMASSILSRSTSTLAENGSASAMRPMTGMQPVVFNETRRRLGSFQICALCTCCGGPKGFCLPSPCCYAINCNIPNRQFGFCSFTPKACNCLGCHL